jgi:hypothetical protein
MGRRKFLANRNSSSSLALPVLPQEEVTPKGSACCPRPIADPPSTRQPLPSRI